MVSEEEAVFMGLLELKSRVKSGSPEAAVVSAAWVAMS